MSWSKTFGGGDKVSHFVDPDRDPLSLVIVMNPGDVLSVLFREEDVPVIPILPLGLERTMVDPVMAVNTRDGHSEPAEWIRWVALMHLSVRLDTLIDPSFRHYRESLEEFYAYRSQVLRRYQ